MGMVRRAGRQGHPGPVTAMLRASPAAPRRRMPSISIITPCHQAEATLPRAVASVLAQTLADWEMLIVADDRQDYARLLAAHGLLDPRLRFLTSGGHGRGPGAARNVGLAAARGAFIAPLDADDLYYPERLASLLPLAQAQGMAGDNPRVVDDPSGQVLGTVLREHGVRLHVDAYTDTLFPIAFLVARDQTPPWDEDVRFGEDTLFYLRAFESHGQAAMHPASLHEYRIRPFSLCHSANTVALAEHAYAYCLERLERDGLGLLTQKARRLTRRMLMNKRRANREYATARRRGLATSFESYALHRGGLYQEPLLDATPASDLSLHARGLATMESMNRACP